MLLHHAQTKIKQPLCVCTRELSDGWARVDVASRASKKAPLGLFCPPDCTAGRCCSNPPAFVSFTHTQNKKLQRSSYAEAFLVGAGGFEQPVHYIYKSTGLLFLRFSGFIGLLVAL